MQVERAKAKPLECRVTLSLTRMRENKASAVALSPDICTLKFYTQKTGTGDQVTRHTTLTQLQCGVVWSKTVKS
jgi:hypothetical protein